jgi:NitT/TauT family transport system ATP-binding protein
LRAETDKTPPGDAVRPETPAAAGVTAELVSMTFERSIGREIVRTRALERISFAIHPHEFVSLIGPSGCGKSTVLRITAGLQAPTGGVVRVGGVPVTGPGTDRATVFQTPGLMPWRTVLDNVAMPLELGGVAKAERRERAAQYVHLVGLDEFADHYPRELSGGMQQRVGIARALAVEPDVLLMDEPFGSLDAISRERMQDELLRIWEHTQKTVLFVTHSIDEAILLSDRVLVMGNGVMAAEVPIELARPRSRQTLLSDPRTLDLMRVLEERLAHGREDA